MNNYIKFTLKESKRSVYINVHGITAVEFINENETCVNTPNCEFYVEGNISDVMKKVCEYEAY